MERFSINILHQQIYRVCRLCGVDHPDKQPIIEDDDVVILIDEEDEETSLVKKIEECVGILVHKDDRMPQLICQLCLEKVNDFYEYRSMCAATNVQTRNLLNLHMVQPVVKRVKLESPPRQEEIIPEIQEVEDLDEELEDVAEFRITRATKAKPRGRSCSPDFKREFRDEDEAPVQQKRSKFEHGCQYCKDVFTESLGLQEHLVRRHTPRVYRYACYTCSEYYDNQRDLKDHESWHKATRTKYQCFRCNKRFVSTKTLTNHIDMNVCGVSEPSDGPVLLVPDLRCPECKKLFKTQNLFEWHSCFLKARANCPKCGKFFRQKQPLQRHYILYCKGTLPVPEPIVETMKTEPTESKPDFYLPVAPIAEGTAMRQKKRGRGRPVGRKSSQQQQQFNDEMKVEEEDQCELPFPPPLEVCMTVKSEETASTVQPGGFMENPQVASRLRSGTMPHNSSDTPTTSAEQKSRRMRRTRSSTMEHEERTASDANSATNDSASSPTKQPMVTLSMETVKQELLEMNDLREQLAGCLPHSQATTETPNASDDVNENTRDGGATEDDHAMDDCQDDGIDHSNDSDDDDAGSTSLPQAANEATGTGEAVTSAPVASTLVDQEHTASGSGEREGVESGPNVLPVDIAIKQEPQDGEPMPIVQSPLRLTIKKERGLLNDGGGAASGTASWTIEPSATDDPLRATVSTQPPKGSSPSKKSSKRKEKRSQSGNSHREERSLNKKSRQSTVRVKQEVPVPEDENESENQNDLPTAEGRPVVRIKPEPIDPGYIGRPIKREFLRASSDDHAHGMDAENERVVAFDGVHIKSERFADDGLPDDERNNASFPGFGEEEFRNHINPFSKSARKSDESTLRSKTQRGTVKSKLSKMINPFALMKQKATQHQSRAGSDQPPMSVPAISEMGSSDPADQLALDSSPLSTSNLLNQQTHTDGSSASEMEAAQQQQSEMTPEFSSPGETTGENEDNSNNSTTDVTKQSDNTANANDKSDDSMDSNEEVTQDQHTTEQTDAASPSSSQLPTEEASDENEDNVDSMNVDRPVCAESTTKLLPVETEQYDVAYDRDDQRYEGLGNPDIFDKTNSIQFLGESTASDEIKEKLIESSEGSKEILDEELSNGEQSIDADKSRNNEMSMEQKNTELPEVAHVSDDEEVEGKLSPLTEITPSQMADTYAATPEAEAGPSKQDLAATDTPEDRGNNLTILSSTNSSEMLKTVSSFEPLDGGRTEKETLNPRIAASTAQTDEGSCSDKVKTSVALADDAEDAQHVTDSLMDGSEVRESSGDARVENQDSQELSSIDVDSIKHATSVSENPITMS